jgi:hypothetical protein
LPYAADCCPVMESVSLAIEERPTVCLPAPACLHRDERDGAHRAAGEGAGALGEDVPWSIQEHRTRLRLSRR